MTTIGTDSKFNTIEETNMQTHTIQTVIDGKPIVRDILATEDGKVMPTFYNEIPHHPHQVTPSANINYGVLDDIEVIRRRTRNNKSMEEMLREVVEMLEVDKLVQESEEAVEVVPMSDNTLALLEELVDGDVESMELSIAKQLTELMVSKDFNTKNFPEMPKAHLRRLKWIARNRGFKHLREVLVAISDGPKLKLLKGKTGEELMATLNKMLSRRGPIDADAVATIEPIIKVVSDVVNKRKKVAKFTRKSHRSSLYTNRIVLVWNGQRARFTQEFGAPSLLERVVERLYGQQTAPVSFQIQNQDPKHEPLPKSLIDKLNAAGVLVIKEKAAVPLIQDTVPMEERKELMEQLLNSDGSYNWDIINDKKKVTHACRWLMAMFDKSIDATYIPSLVTSPIEPSSFQKAYAVFTNIPNLDGRSQGKDGGGWCSPIYDGKIVETHQIRGVFAIDPKNIIYVKGEAFPHWASCIYNIGGEWKALWLEENLNEVLATLNMSDLDFREHYWKAALACSEGYPEFILSGHKEVNFRMIDVVDYNQAKGRTKNTIQDLGLKIIPGFMGTLRREEGFSTMKMCFEDVQFWRYDPNVVDNKDKWTAGMIAINENQDRLVDRLLDEDTNQEQLLEGLASRAAAQDDSVALMLSMLDTLNEKLEETEQVFWYMIPTLRNRIWRSLERLMYQGADGGGISCPQVVYEINDSVPVGHCIYTAAKVGAEVLTYRFPMATPSGLTTLKVLDHMDYPEVWEDPWGKVSKHRMIMNSHDLVFRMQGDDDGDKGGATTDLNLISAAKDVWEHRLVDIEVQATGEKAEKYNEPMWSIQQDIPMLDGQPVHHPQPGIEYQDYTSGMELAARSRRGAVGRTTRLQQRLHSMMWRRTPESNTKEAGPWQYDARMGDRAIAMAWPNQGEIDIEKKPVLPIKMQQVFSRGLFDTQWEGEANARKGACERRGEVFTIKNDLVESRPGRYDVDSISSMVKNDYLIGNGCWNHNPEKDILSGDEVIPGKDVGDPIEWCRSDKRVDLTKSGWEGARRWISGDLEIDSIMHWSFRNMEKKWRERVAPAIGFTLNNENEIDFDAMGMGGNIDFGNLLWKVLTAHGNNILRRPNSWFSEANYLRMQTKMGVDTFRKAMSDSYKVNGLPGEDEEAKQNARSLAIKRQQLLLQDRSLQDFSDLWALEAWENKRLMTAAETAEWNGNIEEAKELERSAESCINSMMRLLSFPESPAVEALGMVIEDKCDFLTKERKENIIAFAYDGKDREKTFQRLGEWVRTHGHEHVHVQNNQAQSKHMTGCECCMNAAKQVLVTRFRADSYSATAEYFKTIISYLNSTGEFK